MGLQVAARMADLLAGGIDQQKAASNAARIVLAGRGAKRAFRVGPHASIVPGARRVWNPSAVRALDKQGACLNDHRTHDDCTRPK